MRCKDGSTTANTSTLATSAASTSTPATRGLSPAVRCTQHTARTAAASLRRAALRPVAPRVSGLRRCSSPRRGQRSGAARFRRPAHRRRHAGGRARPRPRPSEPC
eukprot:202061-Chlamydomonas_euryale.AAC.1